ncbi:MAG: hypothetical protein WBA54_10745 [Acidaminobacteraceae bacterium]
MDISSKSKYSCSWQGKYIASKFFKNRGSVSIEALFTIPIFIFVMMLLIFTLKFLAIDDSFNQCLYESTLEYSNLENSTSDIINSAVFNVLLQKNMSEMNLDLDALLVATSKDNFVEVNAVYTLETPISKALTFKENIRLYKNTKEVKSYVYISPSGKKYHYEDCILTKGNGVRFNMEDIPEGITPCKNCILGNRYFQKKKK